MGGAKYLLFIPVTFLLTGMVATQDTNITIPLNKTLTYANKELYGAYVTLNASSTLQINLSDINKNVSFIVVQAHSHIHNITMYKSDSRIMSTNIGLVCFIKELEPYFVLNQNTNMSVRVYIAIHGYSDGDPIPGGCNQEFPETNIFSNVRVIMHDNYNSVEAAPPQYKDSICQYTPPMKFYMMYLDEMNFDPDVYFDGITSMMTLDNIQKNGIFLPQVSVYMNARRLVSAYPGAGVVFVVVAYEYNGTSYSVYVPTYTYSCKMDGDTCELIDDTLSEFLCAMLFFVGIFLCYFGHRFFKTEMFLAGFFTGVIITYILIDIQADIDTSALIGASVLSGLFFGATWLLFWWLYSIPVLAVMLPSLNLGFLLAAIFYYKLPAIHLFMNNDLNFWVLFIMITLLTSMSLVSVTFAANILSCSVLGAYAAVYSLDFYLGSNLKYIVINTVRRAVVEQFNNVTLSPPFQWRDLLVTIVWTLLASSGVLFQHYHNRGRPPFPPPPRSTRESPEALQRYGAITTQTTAQRGVNGSTQPNERTALLG